MSIMLGNHFFAMLSRMKYINRWGLMRNTRNENISEHSLDTAVLAHALAVLRNTRFGGCVSPERAACLGIFHDATEILTGDMPTPVKYYNPKIKEAYKEVEQVAGNRLLDMLPEDLRPLYASLLVPGTTDEDILPLVKAADKISAIIKCMEECRAGNLVFSSGRDGLLESLYEMRLPDAERFVREFLPSYGLTLDEQTKF